MAALTGNSIDSSYQGLIKTTDNGAISGTAKAVTDGLGNATNIEISNTATNFVSGTVDFTGSTVSGLPGGSAGLVTGGQTNSMKSDASLTTNAAVTAHEGDIVIGEDAESKVSSGTDDYNDGGAIAIGVGATVDKVVDYNFANTKGGIALGINAKANSGVNEGGGIAIGEDSKAEGTNASIAIGAEAFSRSSFDIALGHGATSNSTSIAIGKDANANSTGWGIAIGESATASAGGFRTGAIAIGTNNDAGALDAIAIGNESSATAAGAVALGHNVTAAIAETTSVSALEVQTDSTASAGGILMSDAGGTDRRINIDATGKLYIDNTAVSGGGGAAGLESGTGTDSMQSAASLTTNAANASAAQSIALGDGAVASKTGIAIGVNANNNSGQGITIGNGAATGSLDEGMAIGLNADCNANAGGIAIGRDSECNGNSTTAIGRGSLATNTGGVALGWNAKEQAASGSGVAIGFDAQANNPDAVALGLSTRANADNAVALGNGVTAATADTVSVKALEVQTDSTPTAGGIIMSDAGGTDRRLNIDSSGNLQVDSNVVGAATSFSLPRTTGTSSSGCDVIYSSVLIPANTFAAGDILQLSGAMSASSSANTIWSAYWISTNGTVGGNATEEVNMGQLALSDANWAIGFQKNLYVNVADGTGDGTELVTGMGYTDVDGSVNTAGIQSYSPDWTSNLYLVNRTCIQATNTGVTYVDHGAVLKKIN